MASSAFVRLVLVKQIKRVFQFQGSENPGRFSESNRSGKHICDHITLHIGQVLKEMDSVCNILSYHILSYHGIRCMKSVPIAADAGSPHQSPFFPSNEHEGLRLASDLISW